ncbi:MAG: transposase [Candidatus Aerophobetes bacterium]|nr:transposase [Candidatus Aerophobetes bacterium]
MPAHFISKNLGKFSLTKILKEINLANEKASSRFQDSFPKNERRLLSHYQYKRRYIEITPNGEIVGGLSRMFVSLINLSFTRSLVADIYGKKGYYCYDPASMFCLEISRILDGYKHTKSFCKTLRDPQRGLHYWAYAGLVKEHIPSEDDFSNFRARCREEKYREILQVLVDIAYSLGFLSGSLIASTDGTLFPTFSRFRGCDYFEKECQRIEITGLLPRIKRRVSSYLNHPEKIVLGKEYQVRARCPSRLIPEKKKRPLINLFSFSFSRFDPNKEQDVTSRLLGIEERLKELGLMLLPLKSSINLIQTSSSLDTCLIKCPHLPSDIEARRGVRRSKEDPSRLEYIFGYNKVTLTLINPLWGIELPSDSITKEGSIYEGNYFIQLRQRFEDRHPQLKITIDLGDGHYDDEPSYKWCRRNGSEPGFDYNSRNENLNEEALLKRGYDKNGTPFAPCGRLTKWKGHDPQTKRSSFSCEKECLRECPANPFPRECPHRDNEHGFSTKMSVKAHPRLILRWHRASSIYKKIKNYRTSSERSNSNCKENDLDILERPKVRGIKRAAVLSYLSDIASFLKRVFGLIIRVTVNLRKYRETKKKKYWERLFGPKVPLYLLYAIQRE